MKFSRLPSNWKRQRLAELVAKFDAGISVNGGDRPAMGDECGVLKVSAVTEGQFRPNENKVIDGAELKRARLNPRRDSLIMSRANTPALVGASAYIDRDYQNLYLSDKLWQFVPRKEEVFSMRWLGFVLASHAYRKKLGEVATGSSQSMKNISQESVLQMEIPVPSLIEQQYIAQMLATWESSIEKTEQLITAKDSHYTHELSRLISMGHHPRSHIGTFSHEVSERNKVGNNARVLSVTNSRGFVLPEDQFERRVASADLSNYKIVTRGQYAYNPSRINVGSIARLDDWDMGVLSPMYVVFGLDNTKVNSDYFLHWLDSHEANERIKNSAQGSVRETVSFTEFAAIAIPTPSLEDQQAIASYLNAMREEITLLKKKTEKLRKQKRGLMQKLLIGQWRVKIPEEAIK